MSFSTCWKARALWRLVLKGQRLQKISWSRARPVFRTAGSMRARWFSGCWLSKCPGQQKRQSCCERVKPIEREHKNLDQASYRGSRDIRCLHLCPGTPDARASGCTDLLFNFYQQFFVIEGNSKVFLINTRKNSVPGSLFPHRSGCSPMGSVSPDTRRDALYQCLAGSPSRHLCHPSCLPLPRGSSVIFTST